MIGAILKQLVGRGDIPDYVREAFQAGKRTFGGRGPELPDLMRMLKITIASLPQVFICLDALDEFLPKSLPELLGSLRDIVLESPKARLFFTGRPHATGDIQRYFAKAVVIPISLNRDDVRSYLEMRLWRDTEPEAMDDNLWADIIRIIMENTSNMCVGVSNILTLFNNIYLLIIVRRFLLVSLQIEAILKEVTIRQRRKKLAEMTRGNGLSDAYTITLTRLKAQKGNKSTLGLKVLMWVLYSERPLRTEELCHALGVELGSSDLDHENIPAFQTLEEACLGLITVEASSSTVRLLHHTLQAHLLSDPTLFHSPHSTIAEVSLTYLNFGYVWDLSPTLRSVPSTLPLLEYASCYWANHTIKAMTEKGKKLALRLLNGFDKHISAQLLSHHIKDEGSGSYLDGLGEPVGFTGLQGTAFSGAVGIVAALLEVMEWDANATDSTGSTALTWAARERYEGTVKALLERKDVNPNPVDSSGRTPLLWAAEIGCEGAVKALSKRKDVNPNLADPNGRTPLSWAAGIGCEGAVKALLERDGVNPDPADSSGRTPLSWAAGGGREGVVKVLLERKGVNPDSADSSGRTPLSWAAGIGCEGAVKALLGREDVKPDLADSNGRTPLLWAISGRHDQAVKLFLERRYFVPDPTPPVSLRIVIDVCFFIISLFILSYLLNIV